MTTDGTSAMAAQWLVQGGDERLALDPSTGLNLYGTGPVPRPDDLAFGSSTASTISAGAFADATRRAIGLAEVCRRQGAATAYDMAAAALRDRLVRLAGLARPGPAGEGCTGGGSSRATPDVVLAASGTDAHLFAAAMIEASAGRPLTTITLGPSETGSGVSLAAGGRHFMGWTAAGCRVERAQPLAGVADRQSVCFDLRTPAGALRPDGDIERDLEATIAAAVRADRQAVLFVTDVSKTGVIAPSLDVVLRLKSAWAGRLDIVVDACQWRIAPETLRAYLAQGWAVAVTGSKFLAGPVFSGALLVPGPLAADWRWCRPAEGLADYGGAADWPEGWAARALMPARANFGMLLRWHAALHEMAALAAHHELAQGLVGLRVADAVRRRLQLDPAVAPVDQGLADRSALGIGGGAIDRSPSIFPFVLQRDGVPIGAEETAAIYRRLAQATPERPAVRLGQPVVVGERQGRPITALRLCLSAPLVAEACEGPAALQRLIARIMRAFDWTAAEAASSRRLSVGAG